MANHIPSSLSVEPIAPRRSTAVRASNVLDVTVVLLQDGFASTAIGPIEVFHSAGVLWHQLHGDAPDPCFRVRIASIDGNTVTSLCSLGLRPNCSIDEVARTDIVVLAATGLDVKERIACNAAVVPWVKRMHAQGAYVAGICTGVAFMAEAGLLDGKQATTHWAVAETMRTVYPKVLWQAENFVTEDCRTLCSGGVYASIDLSLYLVEKFCGHDIALQTARSLLVSMPRSRQSGYSVLPLSRPHCDDSIRKTEEYLQQNFSAEMPIAKLAARVGMSPRNFIRRFKAATGRLPGAYIQTLRITSAREMLEHGATSVQAVASKVGYEDCAFFRNLFKRHTGMTPAEYRSRFARMSFEGGELAGYGAAA